MEKELINSLKDLPYVIAICLFGFLIVRTVFTGLLKAFDIWSKRADARNEIDIKRTALDERTAEIVGATGKTLEAVVGRLEKLVEGDRDIKEAVVGSGKEMLARMDKQDASLAVTVDDLKLVRDQQYNALNTRLDKILQELGDVKDSIKALPTVTEKVTTISDKVANISEMVLSLKDQIKVNEVAQEKKDNGS